MPAKNCRRRGVVNIWVILTLFMLIGLMGLACDTGWSVLVLAQLQSAADASALAGARYVKADQPNARQAAYDYAYANKAATLPVKLDLNDGNGSEGDIVLGRYDRDTQTFTVTTTNPNAVKVVANRTFTGIDGPVPLVFGPAFGADTVALSRTAIAMNIGTTGAGMLVLDPTAPCALNIQGNGTLNVSNGSIQVNSSNPCAVCNNGTPSVTAPTLNVVGSSCLGTGVFNGTTNNHAPVVPDPLAHLLPPPLGPARASPPGNGNVTIEPGWYPHGINRNSNGTLTIQPGLYTIDNGFEVNGVAALFGNGVTLYIRTGALRLMGNGNIVLNPPPGDPQVTMPPGWEPYEHVTIFQSRTNNSGAFFNGTNALRITGTLYFPNNHVQIQGDGLGYGNQLIANTVGITGNGVVEIAYTGLFPWAAVGGTVFLVE